MTRSVTVVHFEDKKDRNVLGEGRDYQLGFAFCKLTDKGLETVQPISPCKDYLNDVVYCEHMNVQMYAYGLDYKPQAIFKSDKAYLAIAIRNHIYGGSYANMEKDIVNLSENLGNLQLFMNHFDAAFKLEPTKVYPCSVKDVFIIEFSKEWCKYTYTISLFSLLVRLGQFFKNDKTPMEFLNTFSAFAADVYLINPCLPKIKKLMKMRKFPDFDLKTLKPGPPTHNYGIKEYNL